MFPAKAINSVLTAAAISLHFLDLEANPPKRSDFPVSAKPGALRCPIPVALPERRTSLSWYKPCSWRKLELDLLPSKTKWSGLE